MCFDRRYDSLFDSLFGPSIITHSLELHELNANTTNRKKEKEKEKEKEGREKSERKRKELIWAKGTKWNENKRKNK